MDPTMDSSKTRVLLRGVAKIFKAGLQSKTWDIHGMPHFVITTNCEGYDTCEAYPLHVIEVLRAPCEGNTDDEATIRDISKIRS